MDKLTSGVDAAADQPVADEPTKVGKGRPTPKRREQEAANRRPLISGDKQQAKQAAKEARAKEHALMNEAMQTGEERYLPIQHKGPARRFARNYVDSRRTLGQYFLPTAFVLVLIVFGGSFLSIPPAVLVYALLALYLLVLIGVVEAVLIARRVRKVAIEKFGKPSVRGLRLYTGMRAMQSRRMRMPKPQVQLGERPV